jgi:hypothetical protein
MRPFRGPSRGWATCWERCPRAMRCLPTCAGTGLHVQRPQRFRLRRLHRDLRRRAPRSSTSARRTPSTGSSRRGARRWRRTTCARNAPRARASPVRRGSRSRSAWGASGTALARARREPQRRRMVRAARSREAHPRLGPRNSCSFPPNAIS